MFLKISVLESLFNTKAWRPATLVKRDSNTNVFLWILRNFEENLRTAASEHLDLMRTCYAKMDATCFLTLQSDTFITFRQNCVNKLDSNNKYWLVFTTNQQITGWPPDSERVKIQEYSKTKYSFNWAWKQQQNIFKIFGSAQCFLGPEEGEERGQDNTFTVVGIYTKKTIN